MNYKIILNGVDITSKFDLSACLVTDRLGGVCDDLRIEIPYQNGIVIDKYDEIEIVADDWTSGVMYVDECKSSKNKTITVIKAISYKHSNKKKKFRIWYDVTLNQLVEDVALNCGLTVKTYGTVNYTYDSVCQYNESDMAFITRICRREGYSVKCSGQHLIIFNDYFLENNQESLKLGLNDIADSDFKVKTNCLRDFTVTHHDVKNKITYTYTAEDQSISGGSDRMIEVISNQAEAERFAKGYLRSVNNGYFTGVLKMDFNKKISAGTVIELSEFDNFDGKYIVYELSQDIANGTTYLKIRNTLNY